MFFSSDNAGPVHPQVMNRLMDANQGYALPYGADELMDEVRSAIRKLFEAPQAEVFLVATGTAANALALATYCAPWQTVFCSEASHIEHDECGAPEFYTGAAKLKLVAEDDKMSPDALRNAIAGRDPSDLHMTQRGPVSITQVTENGRVHSLAELQTLTAIAKEYDLPVHLDGARFANAIAALGCSAADMTWRAGVDVVSFGGTKNGCMGVEAVVLFDPDKAREFQLRRKRGAHLFSKHRYLSAQMAGYLEDDLWLKTAQAANANAAYLAQKLTAKGGVLMYEVDANMIFVRLSRAAHKRLHAAGAKYYILEGALNSGTDDEMLPARLVCDWSMTKPQIDQFIDHI